MKAKVKDQNVTPICQELERSRLFKAIKYPMFLVKISGLYLATGCLKNVAENESDYHRNQDQHRDQIISLEIDSSDQKLDRSGAEHGNNKMATVTTNPGKQKHVYKISKEKISPKRGVYTCKRNISKGNNKTSPTVSDNRRSRRCVYCTKPFITFLRYVFSATILLLHLLDASRLVWTLPKDNNKDNTFVYDIVNLTFKLFVIFIIVTTCYTTHRHYLPMCYLLLKYEQKYGFAFSIAQFKKWIATIVVTSSIVSTLVVTSTVVAILASETGFYYSTWPFDLSVRTERYVAAFVVGFLYCSSCYITLCSFLLRGAVSFVFLAELRSLRDNLVKIVSDTTDPGTAEADFDKFVERFRALIAVMDSCYDVVKHTLAAAFIFTPIFTCIVLYEWASGNLIWSQTMITLYMVIIGLLMIVSTTRMGGRMRAELSIFIQQQSVTEFSYTVYGLITVDYSSLMMVGGTILTYGILVLQLKLDKRESVVYLMVNKTC